MPTPHVTTRAALPPPTVTVEVTDPRERLAEALYHEFSTVDVAPWSALYGPAREMWLGRAERVLAAMAGAA